MVEIDETVTETEIKIDLERWQKMSEEDLPGLDVFYEATQRKAEAVAQSRGGISVQAAFVLGFGTASVSVAIGFADRVDPMMMFLVGIPYIALIRYGFAAYRGQPTDHHCPDAMGYINQGLLEENEKCSKLILTEYASKIIEIWGKRFEYRVKNLANSFIALLFLLGSIAFVAFDAKVGIFSYWYDFFLSR